MNNIIFYFILIIILYFICNSKIEQFKSIKYIDILEIGEPINTEYINDFKNLNRMILCKKDTKLNITNSKKVIVKRMTDLNNFSYKSLIKKYKLNKIHQIYIYDEFSCDTIMTNILNYCLRQKLSLLVLICLLEVLYLHPLQNLMGKNSDIYNNTNIRKWPDAEVDVVLIRSVTYFIY